MYIYDVEIQILPYIDLFGLGLYPSMLRAFSCLFAQGPVPAGLSRPYVVLGIEPMSNECKARTLPTVF